jgi:hypothetical protein
MEIKNSVCVQQNIIGVACNVGAPNVCTATKKLIELGYLLHNKSHKCLYSMPTDAVFRGAMSDFDEVTKTQSFENKGVK